MTVVFDDVAQRPPANATRLRTRRRPASPAESGGRPVATEEPTNF